MVLMVLAVGCTESPGESTADTANAGQLDDGSCPYHGLYEVVTESDVYTGRVDVTSREGSCVFGITAHDIREVCDLQEQQVMDVRPGGGAWYAASDGIVYCDGDQRNPFTFDDARFTFDGFDLMVDAEVGLWLSWAPGPVRLAVSP